MAPGVGRTADDGLRVSGGVGGVAVNLEELGALADGVARAAAALGSAAGVLSGDAARLALGAALAPASGGAAQDALGAASAATGRAGSAADDLAAAVRTARAAYGGAEELVSRLTEAVLRGVSGPVIRRPPDPEEVLRPLAVALALLPSGAPAVTVRREGVEVGPAPTGVADLMTGIVDLYPEGGGAPGAVGVQRIEAADGARSWVVLVPGTQTLAVGGRNPFDDATNVQAYAGVPTAAGAAVLGALARAGVRPGEPVLLAGHSQGGMTAMRLAADPAVRERYAIRAVVTAGSPVDRMPTPRGVNVLQLTHTGDVVAGLDLAAAPDEAARTVVRAAPPSGQGAHPATSYAATGAAVDRSTHPSVVAWRAGAREVLGGPGATATTTVYVAERDPAARGRR